MVISVEVRGNIEKAIKVLKRKMDSEGVRKELKRRRFYEKPSVKRKRKRLEARRRRLKSRRRLYE
jgi:small subunit ribosomal protein S21